MIIARMHIALLKRSPPQCGKFAAFPETGAKQFRGKQLAKRAISRYALIASPGSARSRKER